MKLNVTSILLSLVCILLPAATFAWEGKTLVRMRALSVMPQESGKPTGIGGNVKLGDSAVPEVDFSHFFTEHFAAELILATTQHSVSAQKTSLNNLDLGSVNLLPPTLLAQYHHDFGKWKPYAGAGINYTMFINKDPGVARSIRYNNAFGYALQLGTDFEIAPNVYLNFDVKKLFVSTDVHVNTYSNGSVKANVHIDPWLVGLGIGYRF